ncbi:MAG: PAS-domain containing protein, partial [Caulobacterales bacterium]
MFAQDSCAAEKESGLGQRLWARLNDRPLLDALWPGMRAHMGVLTARAKTKCEAAANWFHDKTAYFETAAHRKAKMAERRLRLAIDAMPEGVVFLDPDGRYILWNQRYSEIYTKSADLFVPGARMQDTLRIGVERGDYPEAAGREEEWIAERLAKMQNPGEPHEQVLSDGRWIMIEERRLEDGSIIGL